MFDFRRITLFCLEKRLSKHKMTIFSKIFGEDGPFGPPLATPMLMTTILGVVATSRRRQNDGKIHSERIISNT